MSALNHEQIRLVIKNFKKDGTPFTALDVSDKLAIIPSEILVVMEMMLKDGDLEIEQCR